MTAVAIDPFVDELKSLVDGRNANLNHPFAQRVIKGEASLDELRLWALQRYKGITGLGGFSIVPLLARAPDDAARKHMWETIGEECGYTGEASHTNWLVVFGEAIGLKAAEFENARSLPETIAMRSFLLYRMSQVPFLEALASMVCIEAQNPRAFPQWVKTLEGHYRVPRSALKWFTGHIEADSEEDGHAGEGWAVFSRYATTEAMREQVRSAVRDALEVYWLSLDGIQRAATKH